MLDVIYDIAEPHIRWERDCNIFLFLRDGCINIIIVFEAARTWSLNLNDYHSIIILDMTIYVDGIPSLRIEKNSYWMNTL